MFFGYINDTQNGIMWAFSEGRNEFRLFFGLVWKIVLYNHCYTEECRSLLQFGTFSVVVKPEQNQLPNLTNKLAASYVSGEPCFISLNSPECHRFHQLVTYFVTLFCTHPSLPLQLLKVAPRRSYIIRICLHRSSPL